MKKVKVVGWSKADNINIIDKYDSNHVINTMVYDVEFPDASIRNFSEILIAENIYYQFDSEGVLRSILSGIFNFAKDTTT